MDIQTAYNKGLDTAELAVIDNLVKLLTTGESDPFPNPELEKVRQVIERRSGYHLGIATRNNNIGKTARKLLQNDYEILGVDAPIPEAKVKTKESNLEKRDPRGRPPTAHLDKAED